MDPTAKSVRIELWRDQRFSRFTPAWQMKILSWKGGRMFRKIPVWLIVLAALLVASVIAERVKAAPLMEDTDIVRMDGAVATGISRDFSTCFQQPHRR